jgi:hypothetical protein
MAQTDLVACLDEMGDPFAIFASSKLRLAIGLLVGALLCLFGIVLGAVAVVQPDGPGGIPCAILVTVGCIGIAYTWNRCRLRILLCANGIIELNGNEVRSCQWTEILSLHDTVTPELQARFKPLRRRLVSTPGKFCLVRCRDDRVFYWDVDAILDVSRLYGLIKERWVQVQA